MDDITFDLGSIGDPPSPSQFTSRFNQVEQFCTPDSIEASSNYLNTLLTSYGYDVPLVFDSTEVQDKCKIVNCIYALLNDKKNDDQEKRELRTTIDRTVKETNGVQEKLNQTKRELQQKNKQYIEIKSKLEANESTHKQKIVENNRLREEVAKLKNGMQYIKSQYAHETKRHDQELKKTQERLVKLMDNHYKLNIAQLTMTSYYETTENNTTDNDQVIQVRTMYNDLLTKSSDKERQARRESEELRSSLIKLYTSARMLLETQIERFEQIKITDRNAFNEASRFRLPLDCGGKEAIEHIDSLFARLKEEWDNQIKDQPFEYTEEDRNENLHHISLLQETIEDLLATNAKIKEECEEKLNVYRKFEHGGFFDTLYPTPDAAYVQSDSDDDVEDVNDSLYQIKLLKNDVLRDRRKITEASIELGIQRAQLEAERWAFIQQKRKSKLSDILREESPEQETASFVPTRPTNSINSMDDRPRKKRKFFLGAPPIH